MVKSKVYILIALLILAGSFVSWQQASAQITPFAVKTIETGVLIALTDFDGSQDIPFVVPPKHTPPPPTQTSDIQNGRIICSENVDPAQGNLSRIVSYAADGSDRTYLTTSGISLAPSVSRDGKRIYYSPGDVTTGFNVWVMNIDGSGKKQLTFGPGLTAQAVESPDGSKIAYVSKSQTSIFAHRRLDFVDDVRPTRIIYRVNRD